MNSASRKFQRADRRRTNKQNRLNRRVARVVARLNGGPPMTNSDRDWWSQRERDQQGFDRFGEKV